MSNNDDGGTFGRSSLSRVGGSQQAWIEKYRPSSFDAILGNEVAISRLSALSKQPAQLSNLILVGPSGVGKTTSALLLCRSLFPSTDRFKESVVEIIASPLEKRIEFTRKKIKSLSQVTTGYRVVILDRLDFMSDTVQQSYQSMMESANKTIRFILTCNTSDKIIDSIKSHYEVVKFQRLSDDQVRRKITEICRTEFVQSDKEGIESIVYSAAGDMRLAINNLFMSVDCFGRVSPEHVYRVPDCPTFESVVTIPPPLHSSEPEELIWIYNNELEDMPFMWDYSLVSGVDLEIRELVSKCFNGSLSQPQSQKLQKELESNPGIVYCIGLTPDKLPDLVEHNPVIAIDVLLILMTSSNIAEYLSTLVNMDMSVHSMEVVARLSTSDILPNDFINMYVNKCIRTCETQDNQTKQNRLVRLLCVFLQSLVRHNIIKVQDVILEVEQFCLEFSRIKEASDLFRLLKKQQQADGSCSGSTSMSSSQVGETSAGGEGAERDHSPQPDH